MLEIILEIIRSPFGSFGFVFGLMCVAAWAIHSITKFSTKISAKHDSFNVRMDKTESNIDEIRRDISFIKGSLDVITSTKDKFTEKNSPISLTDAGKEIVLANNLDATVANNWQKINAVLQEVKNKNPYDLQEFCIQTAFVDSNKFFSAQDVEKLKIIAYKQGVPLISVTRMMGILIRDRYFRENNINVDEVDNHDPNKPKK